MIKVSIIVPIYNSEKYLKKCIQSLLEQTLKDIEIILINDGSKDSSEKIVKEFSDKRIRYFSQENKGIGKTRNFGIKVSKGEYLAFVDSDDYLSNKFCEEMYNKAKKDNCDIVMCDFFKDVGYFKEEKFIENIDTSLKLEPTIMNEINLGPCNKIYSRNLLINNNIFFEEELKYEDVLLVVKSFVFAKKIGKVNKCLHYYMIHNGSETTTRDERIFDILEISKKLMSFTNKYDYLKETTTNLIVLILTDYTIQTRYIANSKIRNRFIDEAFSILKNSGQSWEKALCLKKYNKITRLVKTNKLLTKLYCYIYRILKL